MIKHDENIQFMTVFENLSPVHLFYCLFFCDKLFIGKDEDLCGTLQKLLICFACLAGYPKPTTSKALVNAINVNRTAQTIHRQNIDAAAALRTVST